METDRGLAFGKRRRVRSVSVGSSDGRARQNYRACLVRWFRTNMHRGVQSRSVWLAGGALEPGWPHAGSAVGPGSGETPESAVSAGPGSLGAAVYSTNDVLVYD